MTCIYLCVSCVVSFSPLFSKKDEMLARRHSFFFFLLSRPEIYFATSNRHDCSPVRDSSRPDNKVVTTRLTRRGRSDENEAGFSEKDLGNTDAP